MKLSFSSLAFLSILGQSYSGNLRKLEPAGTPSSKFTAGWSNETVIAYDCIGSDSVENPFWLNSAYAEEICPTLFGGTAPGTSDAMEQFLAFGKLKVPQGKEMLVDLSAEIAIFTINQATSKKRTEDSYYGNIGATTAGGFVEVKLYAQATRADEKVECAPGRIIFNSRYVELRNRIGAEVTYERCASVDLVTGDCDTYEEAVADTDIESSIGLAMKTTSAHSFQFICPDLDSDVYTVYATFTLSAEAANICEDTNGGDCLTNDDVAGAQVILGTRLITAEEVRGVQSLFL